MGFRKLIIGPGVDVQKSPTLLGPLQWAASQLIRFRDGLLQKLGGWSQIVATAVVGWARGMHAWADLSGNPYLGIGTNLRLYVLYAGALYDITPIRATHNVTPAFTTISTSNLVTVTDTGHGAAAGDQVNITTQVSVGGIILFGVYIIQSIVDANNYVIQAASAATGSVSGGGAVPSFTTTNTSQNVSVTLNNHGLMIGNGFNVVLSTAVGGLTIVGVNGVTAVTNANVFVIKPGGTATSGATVSENGGNAQLVYLLPSGLASSAISTAYGSGIYGAGVYGAGTSGGLTTPLRQWFLDNWGAFLIGNPTMGAIYVWMPPVSTNPVAQSVGTAPSENVTSFVMMPEQIFVSCGNNHTGTFDPNLVAWTDVADYTDWTPTATNQAGSFRISTGSRIVGSLLAGQQALIWTDVDVWSMTYIQPPFIFGFNKIAPECGLVAARTAVLLKQNVYWMGFHAFFTIDASSGLLPLPCPVWDIIFGGAGLNDAGEGPNQTNADISQIDKAFGASNSIFNEITWLYQSYGSTAIGGDVDRYVKMNVENPGQPVWDYGALARTCWIDVSPLGHPIGIDTSGILQQHETSNDANGAPLVWSVSSGFFDLAEGELFCFIDLCIPDFVATTGAQIQITFTTVDQPGQIGTAAEVTYGPFLVTPTTNYFTCRVRGRQGQVTIGGNDLGSFTRLGAIRYRFAPDGRR